MSDPARTPKPQSVDIAVITVIPAELDALRRVLALEDDARFKYEGRIYWFGSIRSELRGRGFSVALTCIGQAGNSASAAITAAVISDVAPKVAVLVGIAGGMRGKRKIGDVVFGEAVVTYEPGAITATQVSRIRRLLKTICSMLGLKSLSNVDTHVEHRPTVYEPPRSLWQDVIAYKPDARRLLAIFERMEAAFPVAPPGLEKQYGQDVRATLTVHNSVIGSGEKLIRAADFFPSVRRIHGKIEVAEMEAAGFALACNMRQLDWVVVRGISDFGDEFKSDDFHKFASAAASTVVLDFLSHGLTLDRVHAPTRRSLDRAREWAKTILEAWEREHGYTNPLLLTFRKGPSDRSADGAPMTMSALGEMLRPGTHTVLEGGPGAGKTFSLIAIAGDFVRDSHRPIAFPISLPLLAQSAGDIPRYLTNAAAMEREDVDNLLSSSDVILLLDGWNEIPAATAERVTLAVIETLRRFPNVCTLITTRAGIVPPIGVTTRLSVEPVSDESRRQYLGATQRALALETAIRDDPRIDDLTRVPLFLAASVTLDTETASVPNSKYGLLGAVIRRAEAQHAMALQRACGGHHRRYLQAIAVAMQQQRATGLARAAVIEHVSTCIATLTAARTIADRPDAAAIVEALVNFHLLVRSTDQRIRFQHQQFQEWFATEQVHADLAAALPDNPARFDQIVAEVCNLPHWEESVTLLLERLRDERSGWSANAAISIVRSIFGLDAFFGATLLTYITDPSGAALREDVARHLRGLFHESTEESRDFSVACMLATGSSEFQDIVWPLLEHDDRNVSVLTSRTVSPFPVEALGADWWTRVQRWDEERRGDFLGEVIMNSDRRLAANIAEVVEEEKSGVVRHAILEGLAFRGERELMRHLVSLWGARALVSDQGSALFDMLPASLIRDVAPLIEREAPAADDGPARAHFLAALTRVGNSTAREQLLRSATDAHDERIAAFFRRLLSKAAPDALRPWLFEKLLQGFLWDWESLPYAKEFTPEQRDAVIEDTLRRSPTDTVRRSRLRWIGQVWPRLLGERLVRDLLAAVRNGDATGEAAQSLEYNVHAVPQDTIAEVVAGLRPSEVSSAAEASAMFRILPPNTAGMQSDDPDFSGALREALRVKVLSWETYSVGATHPVSYRRNVAALLGVVGTADDADIILRLVAADDEHRRHEESMTGRPYTLSDRSWYAGALTRLGASAELLQLLRRSDYLGSASTALAQRLSPSLVAEVCGAVRSGIESVLSTPESERDFDWRIEVGDAIVALAKLGDRQVITLFDRLEPQEFFHWKLVAALEELGGRGWVLPTLEIGDLMNQIAHHAMHGRYRNEPYLAARCATVLLNSDSPEIGVELARTLLPVNLYEGGDRLIRMLGKTKASSAVQLLRELLNEDRVREHRYSEVVNALAEHGSSAANDALLSELDRLEAEKTEDARAPRHALSAALFVAADSSSAVLAALRERLRSLHGPHAIELATETMHRLVFEGHSGGASPTDLLQSIDDGRRWPIPFFVRETVEKTFVEHRPSGPSMYVLVPRSNQRVRRELFRMMREDSARAQSARRLLILVENARIERGRPEDEPRHPAYELRNPATVNWTAEAIPRNA